LTAQGRNQENSKKSKDHDVILSAIILKKGGRIWMTECDVIRYSLKIPEGMKKKLKKEASTQGLDMSSYICGVLSGDIKRPAKKKAKSRSKTKK
jgi:hypothetical protein